MSRLAWLGVVALALAGCGSAAPGEAQFVAATSRILTAAEVAATGNGVEGERLAERYLTLFGGRLRENKDLPPLPADDKLRVFCQVRDDGVCFLVHVPALHRFEGAQRGALLRVAWEAVGAVTKELRRKKERRLGVGLRGSFAYGALAVGVGGEEPKMFQGTALDGEPLYGFFVDEGSRT